MIERTHAPPGTRLIAALIALGLLSAAWLRSREVIVGNGRAWPDVRLDLNSAAAAELTVLPGLGPALAQRIVDDRALRGRYGSVDELNRVDGLGAALVERVAPYLVVEAREIPGATP